MARFPRPPTLLSRSARSTPRRHCLSATVAGLSLLLALLLAACATTAARTNPTPTTDGFNAGDVGVFVAAPVFSSATATPQSGQPNSTALSALRARDGRQVWIRQLITGFGSPVLAGGALFGILPSVQPSGGGVPSVPLAALHGRDGTPQWQVTPTLPEVPLGAVGSTLYVAAFKGIQPSGQVADEALAALAASDGHPLWSVDLGGLLAGSGRGGAGGSVLATNGTLLFLAVAPYSATGSLMQGKIIALRTGDGGVQWTRPLPQALDGGVSQIVMGGDTIYVAGLSNPPVSSSPPTVPAVLALDASSGAIRWTRAFTSPQLGGSPPLVVAGEQGVYAALTLGPSGTSPTAGPTGKLIGLGAQTGAPMWQASLPGPVNSLVGDTSALYVSTQVVGPAIKQGQPGSTLSAYQASGGKRLWSGAIASPDARGVAVANGSLIVTGGVSGSPGVTVPGPGGGFVEAVSTGDGTKQWRVATSAEAMAVLVGPV